MYVPSRRKREYVKSYNGTFQKKNMYMYVLLVPTVSFRRNKCKLQVPTLTFQKEYIFCCTKIVGRGGGC